MLGNPLFKISTLVEFLFQPGAFSPRTAPFYLLGYSSPKHIFKQLPIVVKKVFIFIICKKSNIFILTISNIINNTFVLTAMDQDALFNQMKSEGVAQDNIDRDMINSCFFCKKPFTAAKSPVLYQCGHIGNSQCYTHKKCPIHQEELKKKDNKHHYGTLKVYLEKKKKLQNSLHTYNFLIQGSLPVNDVTGDTKLSEILAQSRDFLNFNRIQGGKATVVIQDVDYILYQDYKDDHIHDVLVEKKIATEGKQTLTIKFHARNLGGTIQEQ